MQREHLDARVAPPGEDGFTILELMMVILIIGILIAVLTPTFFGASNRAKDRAMQQTLSTATTSAKSLFLVKGAYPAAATAPSAMTAEVLGITFIAGASLPTGTNTVSVVTSGTSQMFLAGQSKSGTCFYVLDDEGAGTTKYSRAGSAGGCNATGAPIPTDPSWTTAW